MSRDETAGSNQRAWTALPLFAAAAVALITSACGSASSPATGGTTDAGDPARAHLLPDVANPVNATVAVDPDRATTTSIGANGGTLGATGSDGTVYTLTVPPNALLEPVAITMTPIRSVTGIDFFSGNWIGVRLQPEGLHFFQPVLLRMSPPGGERVHAFGFSSYGDGSEFHGQPLVPDASLLDMPLVHFSDYGVRFCGGDCGGGSLQAPLPATPTEWEARLQNVLENLFRIERDRELAGQPLDPNLWTTVEAVYHEYWTRVIEPMLPRLMTDCDFSEANLWKATAFTRDVSLIPITKAFESELAQVQRTTLAAIENCFAQTAEPCVDQTNPQQINKLHSYMRMYELMTNTYPPFDARAPSLQCGRIWTGTSKVVFSATGDPSTSLLTMTASFVFEIDDAASTENIQVFRPKSGSVTLQSLAVDNACTTTAGPVTFTLLPQDGTLTLFLGDTGATFEADGTMYRDGPAVTQYTHCTDARGDSTSTGPAGGTWISVPSDTPAFPDGRGTMTGRIDIPPFLSEWSFSR